MMGMVIYCQIVCLVIFECFVLGFFAAFAALLMTVLGELAALVLRLKFGNKVNPGPVDGGEHSSFLFRKS